MRKVKNSEDREINIGNVDYISVRGSVCSEFPRRLTLNRTPPPPFSPHLTTIKIHLILLPSKFCVANVRSCQ